MSDSVDRVFVHALNTVKRIPRTGTARPPASERLKLYGLYKQSMEGDVEGVMDRPVGNTADVFMECEKWYTSPLLLLYAIEAKRRYISTLIETMHNYASQTAEARELVAELEFVWDQIKSNPSSSSMSSSQGLGSPVASAAAVSIRDHARIQQQHQQFHQSSNRLTRPEYEQLLATTARGRGSERLRVLSPVSQAESGFRRQMEDEPPEEEEDEEEEEEVYAEAQDNLFENEDDNDEEEEEHMEEEEDYNNNTHDRHESHDYHQQQQGYNFPSHQEEDYDHDTTLSRRQRRRPPQPPPDDSKRWRRTVEQALTTMTAEIAAVREQLEARALAHRRRTGLWAWLKWLVWVAARQIMVDLALLGMLLIWMRLRGDRRLEEKLKVGWAEVKTRLVFLMLFRRVRRVVVSASPTSSSSSSSSSGDKAS
ncbi:acyl-CoA-binding domain-containing protein [Aspergillus vadensis CBS 113365]|uniref:ACB domain-containing protein n=1 Tax=Aspergillus vadensis (strain CBS 113365 / IMI 142717 / IBT 24658) TaxID=1448311 RepID=A0A319C485_ASPVC|nr:hypothetical protein BO88DRAFT_458799 [Aspergillus vadensis CBS 113365]PYH63622.1 hypothetical protein BO88DRAFT_458799 [Aspergillus vadensis CBS 113365]